MDLSIVVPVYNVESYLYDCLNSLVDLNVGQYEIIIVNDGSTDNSQSIIDEFYVRYPNLLKIVVQENAGLSVARNNGVNLAAGRYISFIDSDDYIIKAEFEKFCKEVFDAELEIGIANLQRDYAGRIEPDSISKKKRKYLEEMGEVTGIQYMTRSYDYLKDILRVEAVTKLYNREFLMRNNLRFAPGLRYEDTLFFVETLLVAQKVKYLPYDFYGYRMREGSIMHTMDVEIYRSKWHVACRLHTNRIFAKEANKVIDSLTISLLYSVSVCREVIDDVEKFKEIVRDVRHLTMKAFVKKWILVLKMR